MGNVLGGFMIGAGFVWFVVVFIGSAFGNYVTGIFDGDLFKLAWWAVIPVAFGLVLIRVF